MRSFIQYKAGATFYGDSKLTLAVRKNYIEYVFNLGCKTYGVINLLIMDDRLVFVANCGQFFPALTDVLDLIYPFDSEMPLLNSLLNGSNPDYFIGSAENRLGKVMVSFAILHVVPNFHDEKLPILVASNREAIDMASRLLSFARDLYSEVDNSDYSAIRQLTKSFEM